MKKELCPECKGIIFSLTDRDLPMMNRTEDNFWRGEYFRLYRDLRNAHKGIERLKKREAYLLKCIKTNNDYYEKRIMALMASLKEEKK